jgi:dynactin complex subunit
MTNAQVITTLKEVLAELDKRMEELMEIRKNPGGPLPERPDRQMMIFERISSLNIRIHHLQNRLHERELAESLGQVVRPLAQSRVTAMQKALEKVSESISVTNQFKAAIKLASDISEAANKARDASQVA